MERTYGRDASRHHQHDGKKVVTGGIRRQHRRLQQAAGSCLFDGVEVTCWRCRCNSRRVSGRAAVEHPRSEKEREGEDKKRKDKKHEHDA